MAESDKLTIPRTILPSINIDDMTTLEAFTARFLDERIFIKDASGVETPLPSQLCDAVRQTAILLAEGKSVMISATEQDLTTEQAAAMLGISRQTLIRLLDLFLFHVRPITVASGWKTCLNTSEPRNTPRIAP